MSALMARLLLVTLIFFSFIFPISSPLLPSQTILDAVEVLSDSGFVAMSLTLQLISQTLISQSSSSSATIFAPTDDAFKQSGQPPLSLLQYHISPFKFSLENLQSLPLGTKIPTLLPNNSLIVTAPAATSPDGTVSLNDVPINGSSSVIFDVGPLAVFGIGNFFDPSLQNSSSEGSVLPPVPAPSPAATEFNCVNSSSSLDLSVDSISEALLPLKSKGYSVVASLLDLQLPVMRDRMKMTVFAPEDEKIERYTRNLSAITSIFHAHVLPCRLQSSDLVTLEGGVKLRTLLDGFSVKVATSGDKLVLNGVPVAFPDMYASDSIVVHGLQEMIPAPEEEEKKVAPDSDSESLSSDGENYLDYGDQF